VEIWRDGHMAETLHALSAHLDSRFGRGKNRGLGSQFTFRKRNARLIGANTANGTWGNLYASDTHNPFWLDSLRITGTVTAASDWGGLHETKRVRPALAGSYEALFHQVENTSLSFATFAGDENLAAEFRDERLERAIGVDLSARRQSDFSHYFNARIADQFDAVPAL